MTGATFRCLALGVSLILAVGAGADPGPAAAGAGAGAERAGKVWVVAIGVSDYQDAAVKDLQFARADARAIAAYYQQRLDLPPEQILLRLDGEATLREVKSLLGTELVAKANRPEDTVVLYFAGHGKKEPDIGSQDLDGFSKYLLTSDSDPKELFGTALGMEDMVRILKRLPAERVALILDTCFSGAIGGARSIYDPTEPLRSGATDEFVAKLASAGKGRAVLTAASVDEAAWERPDFGHGVFTYFLLQGLRGEADHDGDGSVDIDEVYKFVYQKVSGATGGKQNPVKKAPNLVGSLLVGRTLAGPRKR